MSSVLKATADGGVIIRSNARKREGERVGGEAHFDNDRTTGGDRSNKRSDVEVPRIILKHPHPHPSQMNPLCDDQPVCAIIGFVLEGDEGGRLTQGPIAYQTTRIERKDEWNKSAPEESIK